MSDLVEDVAQAISLARGLDPAKAHPLDKAAARAAIAAVLDDLMDRVPQMAERWTGPAGYTSFPLDDVLRDIIGRERGKLGLASPAEPKVTTRHFVDMSEWPVICSRCGHEWQYKDNHQVHLCPKCRNETRHFDLNRLPHLSPVEPQDAPKHVPWGIGPTDD